MQTINYSRIRIGVGVVLCALFAVLGMWLWANFDGKGAFAGALLTLTMPFMVAYFGRYLVDNRVLTIGHSALDFHGITGTRRLRYDHIADAVIETTTVNYVKQRHLVILPVEGAGGKIRIAERLLEGRVGGIDGVLDAIEKGPAAVPEPRRAEPARRLPTAPAAPAPVPGAPPQPGQARTFGRKAV